MNAIVTTPYKTYRNCALFSDVENLFSDFFTPGKSSASPAMDIVETADSYVLKTDLPGFSKENIAVSVKHGRLTIEATSAREQKTEEGEKTVKLERYNGSYKRSLALGDNVDGQAIKAEYSEGVLTVTLPKFSKSEDQVIDIAIA